MADTIKKIKKIRLAGTDYDIDVHKNWQENDPSSVSYIENRTHYECVNSESISASNTFYTRYVEEEDKYYDGTWKPSNIKLEVGKTYHFKATQEYIIEDSYYGNDTAEKDYTIIESYYSGEGMYGNLNNIFVPSDFRDYQENYATQGFVTYNSVTGEFTASNNLTLIVTADSETTIVKQLDAKYIPVDNDTIKVDADGKINVKDLADTKLDKAPDGIDLLDENQKINLHYLSDAIVGQLKFGGTVFCDSLIEQSDILTGYLRDTVEEFGPLVDNATLGIDISLQNSPKRLCVDDGNPHYYDVNLEGFYFIMEESESEDIRCTFYTSEDPDNLLEVGDWVVAVGDKWVKIDNTDAVKTVNGQIGSVTIDTGIMTINKVGPDKSGNFNLVAGKNITITKGTNELTIAATVSEVSEQVQADWNENDPESPAYIKNRTHYFALKDSISESTGFVYGTGGQFTVEESNRFCAQAPDGDICFKPGVYSRTGTGFVGTASEIVSDLGVTSLFNDGIYLSNPAGGPNYCYIVIDGLLSGAEDASLVTLTYTETELKQLDAKYIPVDNETIRIENGKLVGAASSSNVDLSNVDQDINVVNGHSVNISGDLNIEGGIAFGNLAATSLKVTNIPEEDDDVVNLKYFRENAGQGGNVDLTGDVTIGGNLEVGGDLKFNGDFEIASLDAQSVKVNGKRVLVEGDATGGSVAGITTGSVENSLEFFDGVASAKYAIAAGTNKKDAIIPIVGSTLANMIKVNAPTASGVGAIATGGGAEATSAGALAMGSLNRVGVTGFYWSSIGTNTITLSTAQGRAAWTLPSGVTFDWQVGDTISIVNDSKYPACAKITGISGHVITVDKLPFSEAVTPDKVMPDDYTIFACYKKDIATEGFGAPLVTQERWYPRSGCVTIGWAGTAFGIENLVSGSAGFAAGWNNWAAGDFGAAFGRDNIASYASFVTGVKNIAKNKDCIVAGANNEVYSDYGIAFGLDNTVAANNAGAAAIGWGNNTTEACQLVVGKFADAPTKARFVVGIGSSADNRKNGFIVDNSGNATIAGDLTVNGNIALGRISSDTSNTFASTAANCAAIGQKHAINNSLSLAVGYNNKINKAGTLAVGAGIYANTYCGFAVGQYNEADNQALISVGAGTSSTRKTIFRVPNSLAGSSTTGYYATPTKDCDAITYGFLKTYSGSSGSGLPDCSGYQDGAILVVRNGQWVIENPPTTIYTGEVE